MLGQLSYHRYELDFGAVDRGTVEGALLKYEFRSGGTGFASVPAWPQFGDQALKEKLETFAANPRLEPQWSWAVLDAQLRRDKKSALPCNTTLPECHWHLREDDFRSSDRWRELVDRGYRYWKLKISPSSAGDFPLKQMATFARDNCVKLRLDANGSFCNMRELALLFETIGNLSVIDFFEDPTNRIDLWREIKSRWKVLLAADWCQPAIADYDIAVHKPTRDATVGEGNEFVVTSAFDHPLGLNFTAYQTLGLKNYPRLREPSGIIHPHLYRCDGLDSQVTFGDIGFGHGRFLEELCWNPL